MVTGSSPDPGGVRTVISLSETTFRLVACRSPNHSVLTWPRSCPLMTTSVDPEAGPSAGVTEPREMYVYWLRAPPRISPRGVVTETVTVPATGRGDGLHEGVWTGP